jgi:hypothetical protein
MGNCADDFEWEKNRTRRNPEDKGEIAEGEKVKNRIEKFCTRREI